MKMKQRRSKAKEKDKSIPDEMLRMLIDRENSIDICNIVLLT